MSHIKKVISRSFLRMFTGLALALTLAFGCVLSASQLAFADEDRPRIGTTSQEEAIKAKFLSESDEKHTKHVSFLSIRVGGGLLSDGDYNTFAQYNNSAISRTDGGTDIINGLSNSYELGLEMGVMTGPKSSASLSLEYWLKNGSSHTGDFTLAVAPIGSQSGFELVSEISVYGLSSNFSYFLANAPSSTGVIKGIAVEAVGSAGFYFSKWDLWQGSGNINLSTSVFEQVGGSLTDHAPGFGAGLRLSTPIPIFGTLLAFEGGYQQLKFNSPVWKNALNQEITATYSANSTDKVSLDFSGFRSKIAVRKFMSW